MSRFRYRVLGLDIDSPFPCPGFWPCDEPSARREVALDFGPVPKTLADPVCVRPLTTLDGTGTCLHHVPGVARYLVRDRRRITIDPAPGAPLERVIGFLGGTPLAVLCHQWGMIPLNAACVAIGGRAVLLAGNVVSGKSTLALALARQGHGFLGDDVCALETGDVCALETGDGATPLVWPSCADARLWPDSIAALGATPGASGPGPGGRFAIRAGARHAPTPIRPVAMILMRKATGGVAAHAVRLQGGSAFQALMYHRRIPQIARAMAYDGNNRDALARLAGAAAIFELWYTADLTRLERLTETLLRLLEQRTA